MAELKRLTSLEICSGGGGQALGLERAGFDHLALVENDENACATLRLNRPEWRVFCEDVRTFSATTLRGVDLLAGGVPCPPFSRAGLRLGELDERDLFPTALRLVEECQPRAVMLENVKGLLTRSFDDYRRRIDERFQSLGYVSNWKLLRASDFGVPQLRPRAVCVALKAELSQAFSWPTEWSGPPTTVGECLRDLMASGGWLKALDWAAAASKVAPTLVGGSKRHGGPDLGPTQARRAWAQLGVDAGSLAAEAPAPDFRGVPKLTVEMAAALQGFPPGWRFHGRKTAAYRQVGNAFPPPVAEAVGLSIRAVLLADVEYPEYEVIRCYGPRDPTPSYAAS